MQTEKNELAVFVSSPIIGEQITSLLKEADLSYWEYDNVDHMLEDAAVDIRVVVIDATGYKIPYPALFFSLKRKIPGIKIIALLSDDSRSYHLSMMEAGADIVFSAENSNQYLIYAVISYIHPQTTSSPYNENSFDGKEGSVMKQKRERDRLPLRISRRSFLKASAAAALITGAAAAGTESSEAAAKGSETLPESIPEAPASDLASKEVIYTGACRGNCTGGCFLNVHVRDGKVVRTSARDLPNTDYNRICTKGLTHMFRLYGEQRLKYPMKRVGERGSGEWEQITWDEAIDLITGKWKGYEEEFGKSSIGMVMASGNFATCSGTGIGCMLGRFLNVTGFSAIDATVDAATGLSIGNTLGVSGNFSLNEVGDLRNAKTILVWGANPVISQQQSMHFLIEAKEKGAKLVVIDPVYTITASKADKYIGIQSGTDGVLAMAMMNIVLREGWEDLEFLKSKSVAPYLVKESDGKFLRLSDLSEVAEAEDAIVVMTGDGTIDVLSAVIDPVLEGRYTVGDFEVTTAYTLLKERIAEYTPEKAAEICDITIEQIEEVAELYAVNTPSTIYSYFGIDHYYNGHYGMFDLAALAILTGNLGKPGASCGMGEIIGNNFANALGTTFPEGATGPAMSISMTEIGRVMDEHVYNSNPVNIKSVYISHANPVTNNANRQYTLEWLSKVEFIVAADIEYNETLELADIILPAAHWFEEEDAYCNYCTHPYVLWQEKAVEPPFECKTDFDIIKLLGTALGFKEQFDMTQDEFLELWLDSDGARELGLSLDKLKEEKAMRCLPGSPYFIHGEDGVFPTTTGKAQFYLEQPAPNKDYGQTWDIEKERLPHWEPPLEAWHESRVHEKYPYQILSEHVKYKTHSQWGEVPVLLELDPEPTVKINPLDAEPLSIAADDQVKIYNDRGYVIMKAVLNNGVRPGVLVAPKGWQNNYFIEGHFQDLSTVETNPFCANQPFFDVAVAIEKI